MKKLLIILSHIIIVLVCAFLVQNFYKSEGYIFIIPEITDEDSLFIAIFLYSCIVITIFGTISIIGHFFIKISNGLKTTYNLINIFYGSFLILIGIPLFLLCLVNSFNHQFVEPNPFLSIISVLAISILIISVGFYLLKTNLLE